MPKAQSKIIFERENTKGYQATVNFHPSFLHGEQLFRGLALTSKLVGYNAIETGSFCLLRDVVSTLFVFD